MKKAIVDSSKLFANRNRLINQRPSQYYPVMTGGGRISVKEFVERWGGMDTHFVGNDVRESLYGRVSGVRSAGKNMCFLDVGGLQVVMNRREMQGNLSTDSDLELAQRYRPGDYVLVRGKPALTERQRTLSLRAAEPPTVLAAAQQPLPPRLDDDAKLKQNRVLDYQLHGVEMLRVRHRVMKSLRDFLDGRGFVEVETPILSSKANGASAEAFVTHANALSGGKDCQEQQRLELRVAPELWLKRLVIGGLDKVYELGKVFRNEGIDSTHNPEFTTLEFYEAYADMEELVGNVGEMLSYVCSTVPELPMAQRLLTEIRGQGLRRVDFVSTVSKESGSDFSLVADWSDPIQLWEATPVEDRRKLFPEGPKALSSAQMWNRFGGYYVEDRHCQGLRPTLVCNHPAVISPLAKPGIDGRVAMRFELFIDGNEYMNAYEEENCPQRQLESFRKQARGLLEYGDREALSVDEAYVESMKWGMPPTGGVGLGIDRLVLLLLDGRRIEEVLAFGCLDDVNRQ